MMNIVASGPSAFQNWKQSLCDCSELNLIVRILYDNTVIVIFEIYYSAIIVTIVMMLKPHPIMADYVRTWQLSEGKKCLLRKPQISTTIGCHPVTA